MWLSPIYESILLPATIFDALDSDSAGLFFTIFVANLLYILQFIQMKKDKMYIIKDT